jgi:hypothetical protein
MVEGKPLPVSKEKNHFLLLIRLLDGKMGKKCKFNFLPFKWFRMSAEKVLFPPMIYVSLSV